MAAENAEYRQVGNMSREEIHDTSGLIYDEPWPVPSLAQQWEMQGISYIETDPVATEAYTSEQLKAMGLIGVTLVIPHPKQ